MSTLWQDIRYGIRMLLKRPGFTAVAMISLALGIGANTAIFSLVNTVFLRPLPVADPDELVSVGVKGGDDTVLAFSYPNYVDFRDRNEVLSGLMVHRFAPMSLSRGGNNERLWGYLVSGNYFDVLGVKPSLGRTFLPEDDRTPLTHPVVVISYGCWQRRFGADPTVVGRDIILNNRSFRVVGVAPDGFTGTERLYTPEIWAPIMMLPWIEPGRNWLEERDTQNLLATGRLKPGVSREQAEASLNILAGELGKEYPDANEGQVIELIPPGFIISSLRSGVVSFTLVLMMTVALVLLIACTNLASLLLARVTERGKEIAIRLSLGAARWRLVRQLLTESWLLALIGGLGGLLLALWIIDLVVSFKPPVEFPLGMDLRMDWRVLLFALLVSGLTATLFGLVPGLQATKPDLASTLKDTTARSSHRRSRLRNGLVVVQFALSLVLLIAAGLVVRALQYLQTMNPGFDPENALVLSVDPGLQGYDEARGQQFYRQLVERAESLPGVRSAAVSDFIPLSLDFSANGIYVEGQAPARGANIPTAMVASIGVNYFETMRIPLLSGRGFTEQDNERSPRIVIVNETFAKKFFPGLDPVREAVGKRFSFESGQGPFMQIVGVVRDGKYFNIGEEPRPFVYSPLLQDYSSNAMLIVRTLSDPQAMIPAVRREVQTLDANLPVFGVKTMTEHLGLSLFPARIAAAMLGSFGLLALILAAVGIFGVTAYSVSQRTREIGIRVALGAQNAQVLKMILSQGLLLAMIGIVIGLTSALALTQLMTDVLYGVSASDPLTFAGVSLLLIAVAVFACYIPARRAMKVDPMEALRYE